MARFELARDDLEIAPRTIDGELAYFVGDPIKLEFHRLDAMQYEVFKKLDGKTSLEALSQWLLQTHEVEASPEDLAEFVETLRGLNLLDISVDSRIDAERGREIAAKVKQGLAQDGVIFALRRAGPGGRNGPERRARHHEAQLFDQALGHLGRGEIAASGARLREVLRLRPDNARARYLLRLMFSESLGKPRDVDSVLFWRIPIGNPDRWLARIAARWGRLLYNRYTAALAALWVLFSCGVLLSDIDRLFLDLKAFFEFKWVVEQPLIFVLIWTLGPPQIFLHEMAHGLTCRYFGGRVREMGMLIAYLQPTAYCDISSTYLLENKWHRALTCFAGQIIDAVEWAGFVVLYHLTETSSLLGLLSLLSIIVKGQAMIAGLNPLIRSDGYFALTELVNYPNLSVDARSFVKAKFLRLTTGEEVELPDGSDAHARLFWLYTVGSWVTLALLLLPILVSISGYFISRMQILGLLVAGVLWYAVVFRHVVKLARAIWGGRAVFRRSARARRVGLATVVLVAGLLLMPIRVSIEAPARVRPEVEWLHAPFSAPVLEAVGALGDPVRAGEVIVRLELVPTALAAARAELVAAEADLQTLQGGATREELGIAEAERRAAARELSAAAAQLSSARARARSGGGTEAVDAAMAAHAAAQTRYATAEKAVTLLQSGPAAESVAGAQARLEGARAQLAHELSKLESANLKSLVDGVLAEGALPLRDRRLRDLVGQRVETGTAVVGVRRRGGDRLEVHVLAVEPISMIVVGDEVRARLIGMPHEPVVGRIVEVGSAIERGPADDMLQGRAFLRVEATIPNEVQAQGLPADLSATVHIEGPRLPVAKHLWLRAARLYDLDIRPLL